MLTSERERKSETIKDVKLKIISTLNKKTRQSLNFDNTFDKTLKIKNLGNTIVLFSNNKLFIYEK